MPNVAGVQFPYTPQGQQAAQRYQRSLSPRRGLGFRPIRMQEGSTPEHENAMLYIEWAHGEGSDSLPPQFQMNATSVAELLVIMRNDPEAAVEYANRLKNAVGRDELRPSAGMEEELLGNLGRIEDSVAGAGAALDFPLAGRNRLGIDDAAFGATAGAGLYGDFSEGERARGARQAREQAGTGLPPYLGVSPSSEQFDDTIGVFNQRIEPFSRRLLERPPEPWEFQGMRHGGVPRGTMAGELEPRGYLTARQAGETMRERAKGLRGRRNYGGGIGSLYNRYG